MLALLEHIEATKKTPENRSVKQVSETLSKVTGYSSSPQASPLRELTCHLGSHSVTCHPVEVTSPPLPQPVKAGTRFSDPEGCKAELT